MKTKSDGRGLAQVSKVTARIINGTEDLSLWDDEELERGQKRDVRGRFGKPPTVVAKAIHAELVRRRLSDAYDLIRESTYDAVALLREIINDPDADPKARVEAASLVLDRAMGRAPQTIALDVRGSLDVEPWQALVKASVLPSLEAAAELLARQEDAIVDGEIVEVSGS